MDGNGYYVMENHTGLMCILYRKVVQYKGRFNTSEHDALPVV
jgi:hypothetical protein